MINMKLSIIVGLCSLVSVTMSADTCNITENSDSPMTLKRYTDPARVLDQMQGNETASDCFQQCCNYTNDNGDTCTEAMYYNMGPSNTICYLIMCIPSSLCEFMKSPGVDVILAHISRPSDTTTASPSTSTIPEVTTGATTENGTIFPPFSNSTNNTSSQPGSATGQMDEFIDEAGFVDTFIIIFVVALAVVIGVALLGLLTYMGCRDQVFGSNTEHTRLKDEEYPKAAYGER